MYQDLLTNNKHKITSKKGFTLLEAAISILFFSLVALSLSLPFCQGINLTYHNQNIVNANNLAKLYLKNVEIAWIQDVNYDAGILPSITSNYTDNGAYNVTASAQNIVENSSNITIIRRVSVIYKDPSGKNLIDAYMDYNRP